MVISPNVTTTYSIAGLCATTQTVVQHLVSDCATGIKEASFENTGISAYPNPFSNNLSVKNSSENELTITISDPLGKIVYSAKIKGQSTETISADALNSGMYFISVNSAKGTLTKKLIKQ